MTQKALRKLRPCLLPEPRLYLSNQVWWIRSGALLREGDLTSHGLHRKTQPRKQRGPAAWAASEWGCAKSFEKYIPVSEAWTTVSPNIEPSWRSSSTGGSCVYLFIWAGGWGLVDSSQSRLLLGEASWLRYLFGAVSLGDLDNWFRLHGSQETAFSLGQALVLRFKLPFPAVILRSLTSGLKVLVSSSVKSG